MSYEWLSLSDIEKRLENALVASAHAKERLEKRKEDAHARRTMMIFLVIVNVLVLGVAVTGIALGGALIPFIISIAAVAFSTSRIPPVMRLAREGVALQRTSSELATEEVVGWVEVCSDRQQMKLMHPERFYELEEAIVHNRKARLEDAEESKRKKRVIAAVMGDMFEMGYNSSSYVDAMQQERDKWEAKAQKRAWEMRQREMGNHI